ncbi:FAD-dependent monooxygenase [Streptomyces sp. NPDC005476]|uniref:FAD-dependent monooxygenase n=1 Tax=Streptomyces sp. NPDC005476 TaxID=3156882 RepID=UPI0034520E36
MVRVEDGETRGAMGTGGQEGVAGTGTARNASEVAGERVGVVVVGAGAVGLLLACELAVFGVDVVVVEMRGGVSGRPKATTLHARTVQCLARRGHLDALAGEGAVWGVERTEEGAPFHFGGLPGLVVPAPEGEPAAVVKCVQADVERCLEKRARGVGVRVVRGHRVVGVLEGQRGVRVEAEGPQGVVRWEAGFVVGADGARSAVRELAGFGSRVWPATVSALAGDVRVEGGEAVPPGWHRTERGWILARDVGDDVTRLRTLDCSGAHEARDVPVTVGELTEEVSRILGREIVLGGGRWLSRFSDFSRLADSYRNGRVLLAGDAAHVHFPIGGQGLSTGLLDALSLGWRLALTLRDRAGEGLLDGYGRERRPAGQRVIDHTRAQLALMRPEQGLDPLRAVFGELLAQGGAERSVLASMISGQDTVLPARGPESSPWEGRFVPNTVLETAEGRTDVITLLGQGRPLLLLFGERGTRYAVRAQPWSDLVRVIQAEPVPDLDSEALLVRPDGYAGWAAGGGRLADALRDCFGEGTQNPESTQETETTWGAVVAAGSSAARPTT